MSLRDSYLDGVSLGIDFAAADLHDHAAVAVEAADLRAEARQARLDDTSASWRAFKLGIVRGYREATRTIRNGRWGT